MHRAYAVGLAAVVGLAAMVGVVQGGQPAGGGAPARGAPGTSAPSIEQFLKIRAPGAPTLMPDGSLLLRDWPDGVWQLYRVTPAQGKGKADAAPSYKPGEATFERLTNYTDGLGGFSVSPDSRHVILMHAVGGNENTQLTHMDPATGKTRPILADPKVQASINAWLHDSSGFIYSANQDSPTDFHLYRHDFASGKTTRILSETGSWSADDVTRDGGRVLVGKYTSISDSQVFELDVASGQRREITIRPEGGGTASCTVAGYTPDEKGVFLVSDANEQGIRRLYLRDLASGAVSEPLPSLSAVEVDGAGVDHEREFLVVNTNENGFGVVHVYSLPDLREMPAPTAEQGVVGSAGLRNRTLVWTMNNARTPSAAFATTYPKPGAQLGAPLTRQLTYPDTQGINLGSFPLPELITYASFDGTPIPAFLYLPPGYAKGTRIPFLVHYHGGPEGQHRPTFAAPIQYLVSKGYGVLLPNVRGSVGYGRAFHMMDDYKNRWDSVRDGVEAAEWLDKEGYSAPGKMATWGGSYGGYMSVACLVQDQKHVDGNDRTQRLFGAGVNIVGIVNLKTFLEKTAGYRRKLREVEYGPLSDPEFLAEVSPSSYYDKLNVPIFIAHGFNDPRVPVEEAMQLSVAMKDKAFATKNMDIMPRVFIAPDEGHGFAKLDNRVYFYERMVQFLNDTIGKK
ncbi:MAG: S9 family peptidase [Planctomycetota bacterium]|nr:S9 family peptidase [Planctomycetota bacterium]